MAARRAQPITELLVQQGLGGSLQQGLWGALGVLPAWFCNRHGLQCLSYLLQ